MELIDYITIYRRSYFYITFGPHKGKFAQIKAIDFEIGHIITPLGGNIPIEFLRPALTPIGKISIHQAIAIHRLYYRNIEPSADPLGDIVKVFDSRDYVAGDIEELQKVMEYCVENSIDYFNLIKKGWACERK